LIRNIPSALLVERGQLPSVLPATVGEIESPTVSSELDPGHSGPTTLFLTVDVEDAYFTRPILMTGDGIGRQFGVFGILDELDAHEMKATFFVNVYERDRQPPGVVEEVVREIVKRGHEVGLHTHPSPALDFYGRPLSRLSPSVQADVVRWGVDLIDRWTGEPPTSFRAGGYALDDHTFAAMEKAGIAIDSSCFFPSSNNSQAPFTINAVAKHGEIIEAPITTVLQVSDGTTVKHSKLDFNWLSVDELMSALRALAASEIGFATFMMHSFSFIEKATRREGEPPSPRARFRSEDVYGCYVDVYGPRPGMREAFTSFLDRVAAESDLRVRTLREALPDLREVGAGKETDVVPVVSSQ
jgi:peptidoglycan/xylan/chitin deacetylase (PgdA/CDA1 family)